LYFEAKKTKEYTHTLVVACHAYAIEIGINKIFGSMIAVFFKRKKQEKSYY
jgi:hypothetical protein